MSSRFVSESSHEKSPLTRGFFFWKSSVAFPTSYLSQLHDATIISYLFDFAKGFVFSASNSHSESAGLYRDMGKICVQDWSDFIFPSTKMKTRKIPQLDYGGSFEGDFTPNFCSPLRTGKVYIFLILLQIFLYPSRSLLPKGVGSILLPYFFHL